MPLNFFEFPPEVLNPPGDFHPILEHVSLLHLFELEFNLKQLGIKVRLEFSNEILVRRAILPAGHTPEEFLEHLDGLDIQL